MNVYEIPKEQSEQLAAAEHVVEAAFEEWKRTREAYDKVYVTVLDAVCPLKPGMRRRPSSDFRYVVEEVNP